MVVRCSLQSRASSRVTPDYLWCTSGKWHCMNAWACAWVCAFVPVCVCVCDVTMLAHEHWQAGLFARHIPYATPQVVWVMLQVKLQAQRAQLKQSLVAEAMKECTFKPKTNEGQNRELIARILQAEDESTSSMNTAR